MGINPWYLDSLATVMKADNTSVQKQMLTEEKSEKSKISLQLTTDSPYSISH